MVPAMTRGGVMVPATPGVRNPHGMTAAPASGARAAAALAATAGLTAAAVPAVAARAGMVLAPGALAAQVTPAAGRHGRTGQVPGARAL